MSSDVVTRIVGVLSKWIDREVELYPVLVGYIYTMNVDPILTLVSEYYMDKVQNIVELKEDLSNIRRLIYASAYEDYESPAIRDVTYVDKVKAEICSRLAAAYCDKLIQRLRDKLEKVSQENPESVVTLAVLLRIFEWQRLLNDEVLRISIRRDILSGWLKGVEHALSDLVGSTCGVEKLRGLLEKLDLRRLVYSTVPLGFASADIILCPSCVETILRELVSNYASMHKIVQLCER